MLFRSEQAVIATTVISAQMLAALGGAWFPLEITSAGFSQVAHVLPSAWIMDSLHGIILKDWGVADVLFPLGIVWVWIVVAARPRHLALPPRLARRRRSGASRAPGW